jgi:excisionase family DNA binding protein
MKQYQHLPLAQPSYIPPSVCAACGAPSTHGEGPLAEPQTSPPIAPQAKLLLTVEEAAAQLSIGRPKIYQLVMRGDIVSVKIGASRRIPVTALEEFVERLSAGVAGSTEAAMVAERSESDGK